MTTFNHGFGNTMIPASIQWIDKDGRPTLPFIQMMTQIMTALGSPVLPSSTVVSLPQKPAAGQMAYATDLQNVTLNAIAAGGGKNGGAVMSDGVNWRVFAA